MDILVVDKLSAGYGKIPIISNVNLRVKRGSIFAIVGPNGSGKSTLLKTIHGLTTVYGGSIKFNGTEITGLKAYEIAKHGIAYLPQIGNVFSNLTLRENLVISRYSLAKEEAEERVKEVLETFPVIRSSIDRKALTLSGGERQMLAMAMSLVRRPLLMMFDEPASNLAPKIAFQVFEKIKELNETLDMTIILVEQNVKKCLELSDDACLLVTGEVSFYGKAKELLEHPEMGKLYLGISKF
jgi:branched-chain amino acid transport system ATP-binding protein